MAELNKALVQKNIKDEDEKIAILRSLKGNGYGSLTSIDYILSACQHGLGSANINLDSIRTTLVDINTSINQLVGIMRDFFEKPVSTEAAAQDAQLTETLTPPSENVESFVGEGTTGVASAMDPILASAFNGLQTAVEKGFIDNQETIRQTSGDQVKAQTEQTKAFVENEKKRQQADARQRLLNPKGNQNQLIFDMKKFPKIPMPKFPVNGKQFMAGLGKILKGILNPVALIAGVFMHLLPYIILGIAFFKGFWNKLAKPIKEKIEEVTKTIIFYAGIAFLLFKAPALLISTLTTVFHVMKVMFLIAKWGLEVAFHILRITFTTSEHSMAVSIGIFKRICTTIEHIAEMALNKLKFVFEGIKLAVSIGGWLIIIAAVILLLGFIIMVFVLFGDKIVEAVKKIVEVFAMIGGMIYDAIVGIVKFIADVVVTLVVGLLGGLIKALIKGIKWLFGGAPEEKKETASETSKAKTSPTVNAFEQALSPITNILTDIKTAVGEIKEKVTSEVMNPTTDAFSKAVAKSVMTILKENNTVASINNADNTQSNISAQYVSQMQKDDQSVAIKTTLDTINTTLSKWFNYVKNQEPFVPAGKAED